jgi:hypothetical protein
MHVAAEAIELGDQDGAFRFAGSRERRREFRPAIERVGALSRLDLDMLGDKSDPLGLGEAVDCGSLRLYPKPALALTCG